MDIDIVYVTFFIFTCNVQIETWYILLGENKILINCNQGAKMLCISVAVNLFVIAHELFL